MSIRAFAAPSGPARRRSILAATGLLIIGGFICAQPVGARRGRRGGQGRQDDTADTSGLVGQPAPALDLVALDGSAVKLSELKGSVVLLDFWATWCPPCVASLPHVQQMSQDKELAAKGLKVLAVNDQEDKETVQGFVRDNHYGFTVPLDPTGAARHAFRVQGLPTTVVVGKDGKIKSVFVGVWAGSAKETDDAVAAALKE